MYRIFIIAINLCSKGFYCFYLLIFIGNPPIHEIFLYINSLITIFQSQREPAVYFIYVD